jgi:hypothetical protein
MGPHMLPWAGHRLERAMELGTPKWIYPPFSTQLLFKDPHLWKYRLLSRSALITTTLSLGLKIVLLRPFLRSYSPFDYHLGSRKGFKTQKSLLIWEHGKLARCSLDLWASQFTLRIVASILQLQIHIESTGIGQLQAHCRNTCLCVRNRDIRAY